MIFKEAWVNDEDRDMVGNFVDAMLWVEICKYKSLIVKGRQQEHESDPSKFPYDEVMTHGHALVHLMTYAWEKCDLLGLEDEKKILDDIGKEMGFENDRLKNMAQFEEALLEEIQEETYNEELEDEVLNTRDDDIGSVDYSSLQDVHDDIQFDEGPIVLSYLPQSDIHDDY